MGKYKILYICQEIAPYLPDSEQSLLCRRLSQGIQDAGCEVRTFMPRYGCINERRNQLHEVIRLSGMNLIIDDNDHQLIIKVASIPAARMQIYFIDNDDFFARKAALTDPESGEEFADNDERMLFFARGVIETVKKLRWKPDIIHCHGWFSSIVPTYIRKVFMDDPLFSDTKIVASLYGDGFTRNLDENLAAKIEGEGVDRSTLTQISTPSYENLIRYVISNVDGVVASSSEVSPSFMEEARKQGKLTLDYIAPEAEDFYEKYEQFYDKLF